VIPLLLTLAFLAGLAAPRLPLAFGAQTDSRYFPETHHYIKGLFLKYWNEHGALAQQGYPLTEEFTEASQTDVGKSYTVQYFERAIFERHPENAGTPFEVLLTQLGKYQIDARYPNNSQPAAAPVEGPTGPPPPTAVPAAIIGQTLTFTGFLGKGQFQGKVVDVKETQTLIGGPVFGTQTAKGKFVVVFMDVTNIGTDPGEVGSNSFQLRDSKGRNFSLADTDPELAGARQYARSPVYTTIQPSITEPSLFVFDVPTDATGYLLK
jgi:hypothetical protein